MELEKRLHAVMEQAIAENEVMGVNVLVKKDGKEAVYCQAGQADREKQKTLERDTIFRLYSQTKPITAACAMILMERGQLELGTPVWDYLPVYENQKVDTGDGEKSRQRPMLVHDLLRMTSGLVYPDESIPSGRAAGAVFEEACERLYTDNPMTTRELADRLGECPLAFEPGMSWRYGTSADILGAVIEVVSGKKLSQFMQEEIFGPLEMTDTAFWVPDAKKDRLASVYETVKEDGSKTMKLYTGDNLAIRNDMAEPPAYEAGGAGLVSTLDDYMKFAEMLLCEGTLNGVKILNPATVRYMCGGELMPVQQQSFRDWIGLDGHSYANLMRVCKNPAQTGMLAREGEYGWDGWLGMYFANFPKEHMTILMGTQKKDAGTFSLTRKIRNVLLSTL